MPYKIAPSLMCADLLHLDEQIKQMERAEVDFLHLDVMDGHFVPNLALNLDLAQQIKASTKLPIDVHLMVEKPETYVDRLVRLAPQRVSFHVEATRNPVRLTRALKQKGVRVGVALNPLTAPGALAYLLDDLDYVLVMTVEPGFSGQSFIPQMLSKIGSVRQMFADANRTPEIQVDGNLDVEWASKCISRGASIVVAGTSSVFRGDKDIFTACVKFRQQLDRLHSQPAQKYSVNV